jgi:hypothetical protein
MSPSERYRFEAEAAYSGESPPPSLPPAFEAYTSRLGLSPEARTTIERDVFGVTAAELEVVPTAAENLRASDPPAAQQVVGNKAMLPQEGR